MVQIPLHTIQVWAHCVNGADSAVQDESLNSLPIHDIVLEIDDSCERSVFLIEDFFGGRGALQQICVVREYNENKI